MRQDFTDLLHSKIVPTYYIIIFNWQYVTFLE